MSDRAPGAVGLWGQCSRRRRASATADPLRGGGSGDLQPGRPGNGPVGKMGNWGRAFGPPVGSLVRIRGRNPDPAAWSGANLGKFRQIGEIWPTGLIWWVAAGGSGPWVPISPGRRNRTP